MPNTTAHKSADIPELLTRAEAADVARVHVDTLARWITDGSLPAVRLGRRVLVRRDSLTALIEQSTAPATHGPLAGHKA
jgi:excisionase family DNA binding protein